MKTFTKVLTYIGLLGSVVTIMSLVIIQSWQQGLLLIICSLIFYTGNNLWSEILDEEMKQNEEKFYNIIKKRHENHNK